MIRSVETSLKFTNLHKKETLSRFLTEYRKVVQFYIDSCWGLDVQKYVDKNIQPITWISKRAQQAAGKQAMSIIRGTLKKYDQRVYVANKLKDNGEKYSHIDLTKPSKPNTKDIPAELDSRFCKIETSNNTFDLWITLGSLGDKISISIPIKKTRPFQKWSSQGTLKNSLRLNDKSITLFFDCEPKPNVNTEVIGIDVGIKSCLSLSDGTQIKSCPHGHSLDSIIDRMKNKVKGSKSFRRCQQHRTNFINWSVNQLRNKNISGIVVENLKNVRKGKNVSKQLSHFVYADIMRKLELFCEESSVSISKVNPAYTSQKCSRCGYVKAENRSGELFRCKSCNYTDNADLNASRNILTSL